MKKIKLIFSLTLFLNAGLLMAQSRDTIPTAKQIIEKGTEGDIILGKENRKKQLKASAQFMQATDSIQQKKTVIRSGKKKCRQRKGCKTK
jgi:hypothetical protein